MAQSSQSENLCGQCRICMEIKTNQISVFKDDVSEKIIQLADVVMYPDDGLPTSICTDCEVRLNGCYEFREQVQYADKKFRENLSYSQVEIEECIVKQEMGSYSAKNESMTGENYHSDNVNESSDDEDDHRSALQELEATVDPLNHVEVMDFTEPSDETSMHDVPMGHEEPLIEAREQIEPESDPLTTGLKEELAGLETDSRPSTSTAVWKNETPQELPIHPPAANISKTNYADMVKQLNEDVEFIVACNRYIQSSCVLNQQRHLNLQFNNLSKHSAYDTQHRSNEIGDSVPFTVRNLGSDRNDQYSQFIDQTQADQSRNIMKKQIISSSNHGVHVTSQYMESNSSADKISLDSNAPYNITNQSMVISHNKSYIQAQPQVYPIHQGAQQPSVNQANPALLVSNMPINKNFTTTKLATAIVNEESKLTNDLILNPVSTNPIINPTIERESRSLNISKTDDIIPISKLNKSKRRVSHPVAIKPFSDLFCNACNVDFGSAILLAEHKEGTLFICRICASNFNSHKLLEVHFVTHKPSYTCWTCGLKYYTRNDLTKHEKDVPACAPQTVQCAHCQKTVKNKKVLKMHIQSIHGGENYPCCVCGKSLKGKHLIKSHMKTIHIAYEHIKCDHCPKIFLGPENLRNHVISNHTIMKERDTFKIACPKCGIVLKSELSLKKHILTHDKQICELCGESFKGPNPLKVHKLKEHPKKGIFPCTKCDKKFTLSLDLFHHKRTEHKFQPKKKDSICEICGKIYKGHIKNHYLMHSGEKNFECSICKQRFNQRVTRDTHMRVHSETGKYTCDACGKSFRWRQTMENHVKKCSNSADNNGKT